MESLVIAISAILISWIFIIAVLSGAGILVQWLYGYKKINTNTVLTSFWTGFVLVLAIGQLWHFFLPADGRLWIIYFVLAVIGFLVSYKEMRLWIAKMAGQWKKFALFGVLIFGFSLEVAFLASHSVPVHDTGSYHLPATIWNHAFPLVPGLSNLHSRLGFNSSLFVYSASLSEGIWVNRPYIIMMGPFILMAYLLSLTGIKRVVFSSGKATISDFLAATYIVPVYLFYHGWNFASSLSPNGVIFLVELISVWIVSEAIIKRNDPTDKTGNEFRLYAASLVISAAVSLKLTVAPYAFLMWLLIVILLFKAKKHTGNMVIKPLLWMIVSSFLLIGPWLTGNVIISGYPVYPMTVGGINKDWKVPENQAKLDAGWTRSYSRCAYDKPQEGFEWIVPWFKNLFRGRDKRENILFPAFLVLVSGTLIFFLLLFRRKWKITFPDKGIIAIFFPVVAGLLIWFLTAPDPRYAIGYIWILASLPISVVLYLFGQCKCKTLKKTAVILMLAFFVVVMVDRSGRRIARIVKLQYLKAQDKRIYTFRTLLNNGIAPLPRVRMWKYTTNSGLQINVPFEGNQIWDAPLLSSPHPSPGLCLRDTKDLSAGFKNTGEWRPYGYPILIYKWHDYVEKLLDEEQKSKKPDHSK